MWKASVVWAQRVTCKRDKSGSLDAICMIIYILLNRAEQLAWNYSSIRRESFYCHVHHHDETYESLVIMSLWRSGPLVRPWHWSWWWWDEENDWRSGCDEKLEVIGWEEDCNNFVLKWQLKVAERRRDVKFYSDDMILWLKLWPNLVSLAETWEIILNNMTCTSFYLFCKEKTLKYTCMYPRL